MIHAILLAAAFALAFALPFAVAVVARPGHHHLIAGHPRRYRPTY
jgi:hypothetical protein